MKKSRLPLSYYNWWSTLQMPSASILICSLLEMIFTNCYSSANCVWYFYLIVIVLFSAGDIGRKILLPAMVATATVLLVNEKLTNLRYELVGGGATAGLAMLLLISSW